MQKNRVAIFVVFVALFAGGFYAFRANLIGNASGRPANGGEGVVCTMEAKLCPDGVTYVGRTGPHCEFAACPDSTSTSAGEATSDALARVSARIGERVGAMGVFITPLSIVEDSRCPTDVQCIQAGTVRVKAKIESGLGASEMTLTLSKAATTEAQTVTLASVTPAKVSTVSAKPGDYIFNFDIAMRSN
jgi:hypothetical protein